MREFKPTQDTSNAGKLDEQSVKSDSDMIKKMTFEEAKRRAWEDPSKVRPSWAGREGRGSKTSADVEVGLGSLQNSITRNFVLAFV